MHDKIVLTQKKSTSICGSQKLGEFDTHKPRFLTNEGTRKPVRPTQKHENSPIGPIDTAGIMESFWLATQKTAPQRKSDLCIPRNQIARPQFQSLHSYIFCEIFIYSLDWSAYFAEAK